MQKVERLQSNLHLLSKNAAPVNTHVVFVDPSEGAAIFRIHFTISCMCVFTCS